VAGRRRWHRGGRAGTIAGVDPEPILQRVWPGRAPTWSPLGGGITNHNFEVHVDGERFVLRIGGKDTELLGIDRRAEEAAARMAASIGIGPEVVAVVEPEGYLVTRFIEGRPIPPERMRAPDVIAAVADSVRAVHGGPPIPGRFDAHRVVESYADTARAHGVSIPDDFEWAHERSSRIEAARGSQPPVPCHDDLLNANFIDDGRRIRIVDWEYAGMGDRFFDLGNFSVKHDFGPEEDEALAASYAGAVRPADVAAIRVMRFMGAFFEAMWGVVQQGISELDVDFVAYADENFDRLRAIGEDPRFDGWLAAASTS
jgi:thiamine kinase-like enzyme